VEAQGVPVDNVIDIGMDNSIMGGEVFKKVAVVKLPEEGRQTTIHSH